MISSKCELLVCPGYGVKKELASDFFFIYTDFLPRPPSVGFGRRLGGRGRQ